MQGKKALLAKVLQLCGVLPAVRYRLREQLLVLNYHRISISGKGPTYLDDRLSHVTEAQFHQQIAWISRNMQVLDEDGLVERLRRPDLRDRLPAVLITFDDGYIDNYTVAFPILQTYRVPALFFVCPRLITERKLGWWDLISYCLKKSLNTHLALDGVGFHLPAQRCLAERHFKTRMKLEREDRTANLITKLSDACGVQLPTSEEQHRELMSWRQLREVARHGITIGSHTHSHPVLATISPTKQEEELLLSKQEIEREIGASVRSLAYPVGGTQHFTEETKQIAARCGYAVAFSYGTGINRWEQIDAYNIRRISTDGDGIQVAATMAFPRMFL